MFILCCASINIDISFGAFTKSAESCIFPPQVEQCRIWHLVLIPFHMISEVVIAPLLICSNISICQCPSSSTTIPQTMHLDHTYNPWVELKTSQIILANTSMTIWKFIGKLVVKICSHYIPRLLTGVSTIKHLMIGFSKKGGSRIQCAKLSVPLVRICSPYII